MNEIYVPVVGFEGLYEVSNLGNVKSLPRLVNTRWETKKPVPEKILSFGNNKQGYLSIKLFNQMVYKKFYIHRLVAMHFLQNPNNHSQVNHIDGDKSNNKTSNLEWCSPSQNCYHAINNNLYIQASGEKAGNCKLTSDQVIEIRRLANIGVKQNVLASTFKTGRKNITKIVNRQRWKHI